MVATRESLASGTRNPLTFIPSGVKLRSRRIRDQAALENVNTVRRDVLVENRRSMGNYGPVTPARRERRRRVLQIRSEQIDKPFTMHVLHVVISKASESKLFAMWDRTAPVSFQYTGDQR
jgi:hypothetical protein